MTKHGAAAAVLVPMAEWRRLYQSAGLTLKELLLADAPWTTLLLPRRGRRRRRQPKPIWH